MSYFQLSPRLKEYLKVVEEETGMPVKILGRPDLGLTGARAAFNYHPLYTVVVLNSSEPRLSEDLERSVAHEATHGYILHKLGYCRAVFTKNASEDVKMKANLLFSLVEDLVVNRIIQENGFPPFGTEYLPMIKKEIEVASAGENVGEKFYSQFTSDLELEDIIMVSRYILSWGFLRYYPLSREVRLILQEFLEVYSKAYPHHYPHAARVKEIILENDVFTAQGECRAMQEIMRLWGFEGMVKAVSTKHPTY
ncbi:MAG: hypothetical protein QM405_05880 [Euryarchaeota archaeon]|jgi:hypothetical protein|nr:hypothetical protein [Euryarchaeota archaeon]